MALSVSHMIAVDAVNPQVFKAYNSGLLLDSLRLLDPVSVFVERSESVSLVSVYQHRMRAWPGPRRDFRHYLFTLDVSFYLTLQSRHSYAEIEKGGILKTKTTNETKGLLFDIYLFLKSLF